jgi:hypothetical protein
VGVITGSPATLPVDQWRELATTLIPSSQAAVDGRVLEQPPSRKRPRRFSFDVFTDRRIVVATPRHR